MHHHSIYLYITKQKENKQQSTMNLTQKILKWSKILQETKPGGSAPCKKRHKKAKKMLKRLIRSIQSYDRTKWSQDPACYLKNMIKTGRIKDLDMFSLLLEPHKTLVKQHAETIDLGVMFNMQPELIEFMGADPFTMVNNLQFMTTRNIDLKEYLVDAEKDFDSNHSTKVLRVYQYILEQSALKR